MGPEGIDEGLAVNLRGAILVAKALAPLLRPGGVALHVRSVAGRQGFANRAAPCASKAGLRVFSGALGQELGEPGVRVVSVCPGYVATGMTRGARPSQEDMVQPRDLARVLVGLAAQPESVYVDEVVVWPRALYTS